MSSQPCAVPMGMAASTCLPGRRGGGVIEKDLDDAREWVGGLAERIPQGGHNEPVLIRGIPRQSSAEGPKKPVGPARIRL